MTEPALRASAGSATGEPSAEHLPLQLLETVLAEERLSVEHHQRHAPVAGGALVVLPTLYDRVEPARIRVNRRRHFREIEARPRSRLRQVVALVPIVDLAAPDDV